MPDDPCGHARASGARDPSLEAIVVLGCAVRLDRHGHLHRGALTRRVEAAARLYATRGGSRTVVVACGGRRWGAVIEADAMARELSRLGVPRTAIARERCSLTTRENARFGAAFLTKRGLAAAAVVTCAWHMPRATALFVRAGIEAEPIAVRDPASVAAGTRLWHWGRERALTWTQLGWGAPVIRPPTGRTP